MTTRIDGGPAYPHNTANADNPGAYYPHPGMTLRDYFIAHAPAEPQPWFQPTMPSACPLPRFVGEDGTVYATATEASRACGDNFTNEREQEQIEWRRQRDRQRYVQWPAAWADAQLALRAEHMTIEECRP